MKQRLRTALGLVVLTFFTNCGSRSDLAMYDEEPSSRAGGSASRATGGRADGGDTGGVSAGGVGAGGRARISGGNGPTFSGGTQAAGGGSNGGTLAGGQGGDVGSGGDGMGGADACSSLSCRGMRPYWLIASAWGQVGLPFRPEIARCVDYQGDDAVDHLDYLTLLDGWWLGCPEVGARPKPGSCFFPGDINRNRCLDYDDYFAIQSELGLEAISADPCADLSDDGYVDELDLAFLLWKLPVLACAGTDFDPSSAFGVAAGNAVSCSSAPLGDVTGDEEVGERDLTGVLSQFGLVTNGETECLDINRDGSIGAADALHVIYRSPPASEPCREALSSLEEFVTNHKSCVSDGDCASFDSGCSHLTEHCSGMIYLEASVDEVSLTTLTNGVSSCLGLRSCRLCDDSPPAAVCTGGTCQPGSG